MSNFVYVFVCFVAVGLSGVYGFSAEEKKVIHEAVTPIIAECSKEHGVSLEEIKAAQDTNTEENLKTCFLSCAFKKAGILSDKGTYNEDTAMKIIEKMVSAEDYAKYTQKAKNCGSSVNGAPVSDGEAGCDRAKLVLAHCFRGEDIDLVL